MTCTADMITFGENGSPSRHRLAVHRFGQIGARPKIYLQAALHADETPAGLALLHLIDRLRDLDGAGRIEGSITVIPAANPIGLTQWAEGRHVGRFHLQSRVNFNRGFPLLGRSIAERLGEDALGQDGNANVATIRAAAIACLDDLIICGEDAMLKRLLLREAIDADIAIDCHAADQSLLYAFIWHDAPPAVMKAVKAFAPALVIVNRDSGGASFEDACAEPWVYLRSHFPDRPIPPTCHPLCIEHRGETDVDDALAATDADGLIRLLGHLGAVTGDPGPVDEAIPVCPVEGYVNVPSPVCGIVTYPRPLGEWVEAGDTLAIVRNADGSGRRITEIRSPAAGLFFDRALHRTIRAGDHVAVVCAREAVPGRPDPFDS